MAKIIFMLGLIMMIAGCTTTVYRTPSTTTQVVPVKSTTVYTEPTVVRSTTMTY